MTKLQHLCRNCGEDITARWVIGYKFCKDCNADYETERAKKRCIVPMHKSNYVLITDKELLTGVNTKGGIVK